MSDDIEGVGPTPFAFIGRNVRELRRSKGWTQAQLGNNLRRRKLSRQAISWIESGKNTDLQTIADIATTLGVSVATLITGDRPAPAFEPRGPAELVSELLKLPTASWRNIAATDKRYWSPAVVRALMDRAYEELDNSRHCSRDMCVLAAKIVEWMANTDSPAPAELRVETYRYLAFVTSMIGEDGDTALPYLELAEAAASECANPIHQRATVKFARAIILTNMEQFSAARELLHEARSVFEKFDRRRYLLTFHQEAIIDSVSGDPREAERTVARVIDEIASWGDESELGRLYTVLSHAWLRIGEPQRAMEYLEKAAEIHTRYGTVSEIARDIWRHAAVSAEMGNYETAFRELAEARRRLLSLDLKQDAVSVDLYYLRAKVAAGADHHELHAISSRLAADAVAARLPVTACEAIDWLRRISRRLTPAAVDHVRSYVTKAERKPALAFEPPDA